MASIVYATKLKKLFQRMGTTAAAYAVKHGIGHRLGYGKMKNEIVKILPEYSSFAASATTPTQTTLTWSGITGSSAHTLKKSTNYDMSSPSTVYTGALLTSNATGLTAGTTYYFQVTASGTDKVSSSSSIIKVSTQLAAPGSFTASAVTATTMTLTWNAVTGASGYLVERATNAGFSTGLTTVYTGTALTTPVTGLTTGTTYYFRVKATSTNFTGAYSTLTQATS